jgi:hypothetical protein
MSTTTKKRRNKDIKSNSNNKFKLFAAYFISIEFEIQHDKY